MRELFQRTEFRIYRLGWNFIVHHLFQFFMDSYQSPVVDGVDVDVDELDAEREALADGDPVHLNRMLSEKIRSEKGAKVLAEKPEQQR